jgi:hypothetical protein
VYGAIIDDDEDSYGASAIKAAKNTARSRAAHKRVRQGHTPSQNREACASGHRGSGVRATINDKPHCARVGVRLYPRLDIDEKSTQPGCSATIFNKLLKVSRC